MSIEVEIESIAAYIEPMFDGPNVYYQRTPAEPKVNELTVRYLTGESESETSYHYRLDRDYQIVYFGQSELDCMARMDAIERQVNSDMLIPIGGSDRYIRAESFSFSQPIKTEGGNIDAIIGVLSVSVREARPQKPVEKINRVDVEVRYKHKFEI